MKKNILLILIIFNVSVFGSEYNEIYTKYFKIIYNKKLSPYVKEFAEKADKNGEKVFDFYKFNPKKKYDIIFKESSDVDNGVTDYDTIKLYFNQPPVFYIEKNYENWIDYLFVHELTHLIINQKSGGVIGKTSILKPILQQMFIPAWYQEGLAVYTESNIFKGGRGVSPRFNMYMNMVVHENKFEGMEFSGNYKINGNNPYIYGYSFIQFIAEEYGEEELKKEIEKFSKHQIRGPFYEICGKSRKEIAKEWKEWAEKRYKTGKGEKEGEEFYKKIADKRYMKYYEEKLYFYSEKNDESKSRKSGIYYIDINTKKIKKYAGGKIADGFEVNEAGMYYSVVLPDLAGGKQRVSSFKKNLKEEEYQQLKKAVNFFSIDGKAGAVIRENGKERAVIIGEKEIIGKEHNFKFEKFCYGEGKLYFSASLSYEEGNCIYSYSINDGKIEKITDGYSPYYYKNFIYYSKNYKGIYNIFRIVLNSGKIERVTDVKYGAFDPVISDKGKLYYLNYGKEGYSIYKIENITEVESKKEIESEEKVEKIGNNVEYSKEISDYNINKFRNKLNLKNGIITNKSVILNFADRLNEKKIIVIAGKIKYSDQKREGYKIFTEIDREKLGAAAVYLHSNGGMPLFILYGDKVDGDKGYISGTFNIPYFYKPGKLLFLGEAFADSNKKLRSGMSLFGAAGYRAEYEDNNLKNELYLNLNKFKVNYYFSKDYADFEGSLTEGINYNIKNSFVGFDRIGYRFYTIEALVVQGDAGYTFEINRGTDTGRNVLKSIRAGAENIYAIWNNYGERAEIAGLNLYFESSSYLNYNMECKFRIGLFEQYKIEESKFSSEKEIPYINVTIGF